MPSLNNSNNLMKSKLEPAGISLIKATINLMNELVEVMSREIEIISERKMEEHKELLVRKQRLTMDYRANMKTIIADPGLLKDVPPELRATAKTAGQKLVDMTDRNAKFLRGAVLATQRLIQNIVSIVKQEVLPKASYKNPTTAHMALGVYSPTCKPVSVNRTA